MHPSHKRRAFAASLLPFILVVCGCDPISYHVPVEQAQRTPSATLPALREASTKLETGSRPQWQAATYKGLVMGESSREDMLRVLGPPAELTPAEGRTQWYSYQEVSEFTSEPKTGELTAVVNQRSGKVVAMHLGTKDFTVEEAIKRFGSDYIKTGYDFDECVADPKEDALYETPNGFFRYIEYRERGIALLLDKREEKVVQIEFISQPIGTPKPRC